jgi:hypothetical protein
MQIVFICVWLISHASRSSPNVNIAGVRQGFQQGGFARAVLSHENGDGGVEGQVARQMENRQ